MPRKTLSLRFALSALALAVLCPDTAFASTGGTGLPWESGIQLFVDSITGPVGAALVLCCLAVGGIRWMKSGHGEGADWVMRVAMGGACVIGGTNILALFGLTGSIL